MTSPSEDPVWKQRALERSAKTAKVRSGRRVQLILDAAHAVMAAKGSTDFTVQEVIDRSGQSLRSFYLRFDGKHDLLLAVYEDTLSRAADRIGAATLGHSDPLDRVKDAVQLLFELSRPDPTARRPSFPDFAPHLLIGRPGDVAVVRAPLVRLFTELLEGARAEGRLRRDADPARLAAMMIQTVMFTAVLGGDSDQHAHPLTADEVWRFCSVGFGRA